MRPLLLRICNLSNLLIIALLFTIGGCEKNPVTKILVISDSMGTGYDIATPFPDRIANAVSVELVNNSENGLLTSQIIEKVPNWLTEHKPSHLLIFLGTNDAIKDQVGDAIVNLQNIVELAIENEITPIIATVPVYLRSETIDARTAQISDAIRKMNNIAAIADIRLALGDGSKTIGDGIHPNDHGQKIIAEKFQALM